MENEDGAHHRGLVSGRNLPLKNRMSNVEQGLPAFGGARGDQGISNDEVKFPRVFPSVFVIRYSTFCGSFLNFGANSE
jgi:hypothetical protein